MENEIARVLRKTKQEKIRYRDGWRNKTVGVGILRGLEE